MKKQSTVITIAGKIVTAQQVAAFNKSFAGQSEIITTWANYCTIHAVAHNNIDPLNAMLNNAAFRLTSGKASKLGKEVFSFIKAHAPQIQEDTKTGRFIVKKMKVENPQYKHFADPSNLDDDGKPAIVEPGDFALSFDAWRVLEKPEKEEKPVTLKASTVAGQIGKALEALAQKRFAASAEEADGLLAEAMKLQAALVSLTASLQSKAEPIDTEKAAELLKSGQAGKSKRAGGKVAPVAV